MEGAVEPSILGLCKGRMMENRSQANTVIKRPVRTAAFMPALAMAALTAAGGLAAQYIPPTNGQMAVVFPPFTDELTAWQRVTDAGGQIVAPSHLSNIVVAYAPDTGFAGRVRSTGALFTLAATGLCQPLSRNDKKEPL